MNVELTQTEKNVHFKSCGELTYNETLDKMVALPVVEKQIKWSKWCKVKSLVGTVKETVMQVSHSKKWKSPQLPC